MVSLLDGPHGTRQGLDGFVVLRFYKHAGPSGPCVCNQKSAKKVEIAKRTQFLS
jgi:hypothetical protein